MNSDTCPHRIGLEVIRRPANALNIEMGGFGGCDRCKLKPPEEWGPNAPSVMRWLLSGGSPMVLGRCTPNNCPSTDTVSAECSAHRASYATETVTNQST